MVTFYGAGLGKMLSVGSGVPLRASAAARATAVNVSGVLREAMSCPHCQIRIWLVRVHRSGWHLQVTLVVGSEFPFQ